MTTIQTMYQEVNRRACQEARNAVDRGANPDTEAQKLDDFLHALKTGKEPLQDWYDLYTERSKCA